MPVFLEFSLFFFSGTRVERKYTELIRSKPASWPLPFLVVAVHIVGNEGKKAAQLGLLPRTAVAVARDYSPSTASPTLGNGLRGSRMRCVFMGLFCWLH